jgi:glycine hydroxymethyltransferase
LRTFKDKALWEIVADYKPLEFINLIASENYVSEEVAQAQGLCLMNKYAEGYPGKRYYQGCSTADQIETLAIERLKSLYGTEYANVQPHSGSQANQAVYLALLQPGDTILSLALDHGGHLTHGHRLSSSGKLYRSYHYYLNDENQLCYESIREIAIKVKPKLIVTGYSCYTHLIDFERFRKIADEVGAYLLVDIAHIAGLIAGGVYPSPVPYADVITGTTHKVLRGPRGGMIMAAKESLLTRKINSAVFPGVQGGPMVHTIAAKAVAFFEAAQPEYRAYTAQVVLNAQTLATTLEAQGIKLVFKSTETHTVVIDLSDHTVSGRYMAAYLETLGIITNANMIPRDQRSALESSGLRLGTAAITTLGFREADCVRLGEVLALVIQKPEQTAEAYRALVKGILDDVLGRI